MIRLLLLLTALGIAGGAALGLPAETHYRLLSTTSVGALLAPGDSSPAGVVFVFQPKDCFGSGGVVEQWNRLHARSRVPVRGRIVGDGTPPPVQKELFRDMRVEMPIEGISAQAAATVAERLGYARTPFAVVLDKQGRVVASFPAEQNIPAEVLEELALGTVPP